MTDASDSDLFGNGGKPARDEYHNAERFGSHAPGDDLYRSKHDIEEYGPFAQAQTPVGEPLFPTVPTVEDDAAHALMADPVADRVEHGADDAWKDATPPSVVYEHTYQSQIYDSQGYRNLDYSVFDLPETPAEQDTPVAPAAPDFPAVDVPQVEAVAVEVAAAVDDAPEVVEFTAPPDAQPVRPKAPLTEREMRFKREFAGLMNLMQHGAWPQALAKLQAMRTEFPEVAALDNLLDEATLKAELMATWTHKIKGRRLTVGQAWLIRRSLPFLLLLILFLGGGVFYQTFVAPSRQVLAMERANQALIDEAAGLLKVGQIDEAIGLFNVVLSRNPDNVTARQGLADASKLVGLATTYDLAIRVANKGNLARSLHMLEAVKAKSPSFRDIDARITRVRSLLEAEAAYRLAEKAFAQHRWTDAVAHYEATQRAASDYQAVRVELQLSAAHFWAAQKLMTQWPTPEFGTQQIREFLRKAQEINGQDEASDIFLVRLDDFMRGERELNNANLAMAIRAWQPLYEAQPDFLGGYLAEQLYRAYLALASEVRVSDAAYARELYTLAAVMPVHDPSEARAQLQSLGAATPAAQPTPTPRPHR